MVTQITQISQIIIGRLRLKIKAKIEFKIKAVGILSDDAFSFGRSVLKASFHKHFRQMKTFIHVWHE